MESHLTGTEALTCCRLAAEQEDPEARAMAVLKEPVRCHYLFVPATLSLANHNPMPSALL